MPRIPPEQFINILFGPPKTEGKQLADFIDFKETFTRFINLPLSTDRGVPSAYFSPDDSQLRWGRSGAGNPLSSSGFRLSVRVEV